jgi:hypothetical protein
MAVGLGKAKVENKSAGILACATIDLLFGCFDSLVAKKEKRGVDTPRFSYFHTPLFSWQSESLGHSCFKAMPS